MVSRSGAIKKYFPNINFTVVVFFYVIILISDKNFNQLLFHIHTLTIVKFNRYFISCWFFFYSHEMSTFLTIKMFRCWFIIADSFGSWIWLLWEFDGFRRLKRQTFMWEKFSSCRSWQWILFVALIEISVESLPMANKKSSQEMPA